MPPKKKASKRKPGTKAAAKPKSKREPQPLSDDKIEIPKVSTPDYRAVDGPEGAELKSAMRDLMGQVNKSSDHKLLAFAEDVPNTYELRRPSGIMQLDVHLGGGLPAGTLGYISGPDGAGKTFLALLFMLLQQRLYGPQCALAFAPVEGGFDFRRALNIGLKIAVPDEVIAQWDQERQLRGLPPYTREEWASFKEQVGEFMIIRGYTGEQILESVLEAYRTKMFNMITVDSVSALQPSANAVKDLDDNMKMAAHASLVSDFMKKFMPLTTGIEGPNYSNLVFTSQVRANMKKAEAASYMQKYLKDWAVTGAHAARHTKAVDIAVWDGEKIKKTVSGKKVTIGKVSKYEFFKGKYGSHEGITGEYKFMHESELPQGVDSLDTVMIEGMRHGIIREKSGQVAIIQPETGEAIAGMEGMPNLPTLKRMMEIDFEFELAVRREILASQGISCLYR